MTDSFAKTELANISEDGAVPKRRIPNSNVAHSIWKNFKDADDRAGAVDRAAVERMYNGARPFDHEELKRTGQAHRANFNDGTAAAILQQSESAYIDLISSVNDICHITVDLPDAALAQDCGRIMTEEYTKLCNDQDDYAYAVQLLAREFIKHGLVVALFPDEFSLSFDVKRRGQFRCSLDVKANERFIDACFTDVEMKPHELYEYIRNPERAKNGGWNREAVLKSIAKACPTRRGDESIEELEFRLKNNDLGESLGRTVTVHLTHCLVKEFSGRVSHYLINTEFPDVGFLFERPERFDAINQCMVIFTFGVGNGTIGSIRGQGHAILNAIQYLTASRMQMLDMSRMSSSLPVRWNSPTGMQQAPIFYQGPISHIPPGVDFIPVNFPNLGQNVIPVIAELQRIIQNNTGAYHVRQITPDGRERTATEVEAQIRQHAILSTASMELFYLPWRRLHKERVRRLTSPLVRQSDKGAAEIFAWRKRCMERGVPSYAFERVVNAEPERAVGQGSSGMRMLAFRELVGMMSMFDEVGQREVLRAFVASHVGPRQAERIVPRSSEPRPTVDSAIVQLENNDLSEGKQVIPTSNQSHMVHIPAHLQAMAAALQGVAQGQAQPESVMAFLMAGLPHVQAHLQFILRDPFHANQVGQFTKQYQEIEAQAQSLLSQLQAEAAKQQQAQMQQQAALAGQPLNQEEQLKLQDMAMKLQLQQAELEKIKTQQQIAIERHQASMAEKAQKAAQRDVLTSLKVAEK